MRTLSTDRAPLSPFAFPSDTDFRFVLVVVAVLGSTLFIYNTLAFRAPGQVDAVRTSAECLQSSAPSPMLVAAAVGDLLTLSPDSDQQRQFTDAAGAYANCITPFDERHGALILAGLSGLVVLAGVIYSLLPGLIIRRQRLQPLRQADAPQVVAQLREMCDEVGLTRRPTFLWDPLRMDASGLAFGHFRRKYVALSAGLIVQAIRDRPGFRAKMLHELAHLRNADVDKTYLTISLCLAFIVAAFAPFAVGLVIQPPDWILNTGLRTAAIAAFVCLSGAAVLRAREVYADARAAACEGADGGALDAVLEKAHRVPRGWKRLVSVHPDADTRRLLVTDPRSLFQPGLWEAFSVGLGLGIAAPSLLSFISYVTARARDPIGVGLAVGVIYGSIIMGIVGLGVWRSTFAANSLGDAPSGQARLALAVGAGSVLGRVVSFDSLNMLGPDRSLLTYVVSVLGEGLIWGLLLAMFVWLALAWIRVGASAWWCRSQMLARTRTTYAIGLIAAAAILAMPLGEVSVLSWMSNFLAPRNELGAALMSLGVLVVLAPGLLLFSAILLPQAAISLALLSLWAFPLSSALLGGRTQAGRLRAALLTGVIAGLAGGLLVVVHWNAWRAEIPRGTATDAQIFELFVTNLVFAWASQVLASSVTAARARSVLHGLAAAFVAGCTVAASILAANVWQGLELDLSFAEMVFALVVNAGGPLALVAAFAACALAHRVQARRAQPGWVPAGRPEPG